MNPTDLLTMLADHPDGLALSQLTARLGQSAPRVCAGLDALRAEGLEIGTDDEGIRLQSTEGWGPATLSWRTGRPVEWHRVCASTNRLARARCAEVGAGRRALPVVVADHQTEGRGRRGRSWEAEAGANLLFSVVLRPKLPPHDAPRAVLAWAAAMAQVLDVGLKWPNDLVVREGSGMRKLGGLLAELETSGEGAPFVVLGVGINVNQVHFEGLPDATSLAQLGRSVEDRAALLGRLVRAIDAVDLSRPDLLDLWRARAVMLGEEVVVGDVRGVATGVRHDGALLVGGQVVLAGDVELV